MTSLASKPLLGLLRNTGIAVALSFFLCFILLNFLGITALSHNTLLLLAIIIPAILTPIFTFQQQRLSVQLEQAQQEVHRLGYTDELTGLFSRRYFFEVTHRELKQAVRYGYAVSFLVLDIDHFKNINDSLGHLVGDHILKQIAKSIRQNLRDTDFCARFGGEEFIVLMPHTDQQQASMVAERVRTAIAYMPIVHENQKIEVTVSIGAVSTAAASDDYSELIHLAEEALKLAKRNGRNRVELASIIKNPTLLG